jgi:hypothetical protein
MLSSVPIFCNVTVVSRRSSHTDLPLSLYLTKCFLYFVCGCSISQRVKNGRSLCVCRLCVCQTVRYLGSTSPIVPYTGAQRQQRCQSDMHTKYRKPFCHNANFPPTLMCVISLNYRAPRLPYVNDLRYRWREILAALLLSKSLESNIYGCSYWAEIRRLTVWLFGIS